MIKTLDMYINMKLKSFKINHRNKVINLKFIYKENILSKKLYHLELDIV